MQEPARKDRQRPQAERSEFVDALQKGLMIGLVALVIIVPWSWKRHWDQAARQAQIAAQQQQEQAAAAARQPPVAAAPQAAPIRLADFRDEDASPDARLVANWVLTTRNNGTHAFILVDKKDARVYVFSPDGHLQDSAPALLGAARGDDSYPGIGDKPLSQVKPYEKTTPAGRFVAEMGRNAGNEDVIWVSYDVAVSMHRVRPLVARERRLERLATLTTDDNRISFGCINLPVRFYEDVAKPAVLQHGAIIYVLPDVKTPQQVFGAYDVTDPAQVAAARGAAAIDASRQLAPAAAPEQKVSFTLPTER